MTLYTIADAAAQLGVSKATLRKWATDGLVPCMRMPNGFLRWTPEQIDEIKTAMYQPATVRAS